MKKPEMKVQILKSKTWGDIYKKLSQDRIISKMFKPYAGSIFASSAGEPCELKIRYAFEGTPTEIKEPWHGKENKIGDAIHYQIQEDLKLKFKDKVEIEQKYPFKLNDKVTINCKIDAILRAGTIDQHKILEFKTVKDNEGKEPVFEHYLQVQFYLGVTGLRKAALSYFKRSNGIHINTFEIDYDEDAYKYVVDKFERVYEGRDLEHDNESCVFCPYTKVCNKFALKKGFGFGKSR